LAGFGGLGYAASAVREVTHVARAAVVQPKAKKHPVKVHKVEQPLSSAAAQYGHLVALCVDVGKQAEHTVHVGEDAVPSYLARGAHRGACHKGGVFKPKKV